MTQTFVTILVVLLLAVAGCVGGPASDPSNTDSPHTTAPSSSDEPTTATTPASDDSSSDAKAGTVNFYVSDEPNAIADFAHLNVTITKVGFERAGGSGNDSGGWVEFSVENRTVDLTRLLGDNATLVGTYGVPDGTYGKTFAYVGEVNATLTTGEHVRVKLPSQKLQIKKQFTVGSNSSVDFVFDIAVHEAGKSGKYILKPVIGESGANVPVKSVDDEQGEEKDGGKADDEKQGEGNETAAEAALNATFVGNVTAGENATLQVTKDGTTVENATVTVNEEVVGTTDADGTLTFVVPNTEKLAVKVRAGEAEVELEVEFEDETN